MSDKKNFELLLEKFETTVQLYLGTKCKKESRRKKEKVTYIFESY